jgi:serine-type D-Ala-D-Ala endopeptidase (penicillin-binding protein 7)
MQQERRLHSLEKIVVAVALVAVLFLAVGFAQAQEGPHARRVFLRSSSVLVQDAKSGEIILSKNADAVQPIASISKLMTAMVVLDRGLDLSEPIEITDDDIDTLKGTRSRLRVGSVLTRDQLLLVALMASENRAAAALCRTFPGGTPACVEAMNAKARALGMTDTVKAAYQYAVIRQDTTSESAYVNARGRMITYHNTNGLVRNPRWDIDLSKTGYISEAGRCLVMRLRVASKDLIVVLLDSWGKYSRIGDANRIRKWLESSAFDQHRG